MEQKLNGQEPINNGDEMVKRNPDGTFAGGVPNPNGRPKGKTLTEVIRTKLEELSPDKRRTAMEWLADNILQDALDHDNSMRKLIWNYLEGLPKQSIDLGNTGNLPFTIKIEQINGGSTTTESKDGQIV